MAFDWKSEASKSISRETISSSLKQNSIRSKVFDDFWDDRLEDELKALVIESLIEWKVDSMVCSWIFANIIDMSCSWEVIFEFMERTGHNSISQIKRLFDSISMMDIYVNVENSLISFQQLEDSQHTVVDVAESWGLRLFGMMQSSWPIDAVAVLALGEEGGSGYVVVGVPIEPVV